MKPTYWIGSSKDDVSEFPTEVKKEIGFALFSAQHGETPLNSVPLAGFRGSKVPEVIVDYDGDTYRAVYTVKFKDALYVLHAFKKKSHKGISTPKHEINLIKSRLKVAEDDYKMRQKEKASSDEKSA